MKLLNDTSTKRLTFDISELIYWTRQMSGIRLGATHQGNRKSYTRT